MKIYQFPAFRVESQLFHAPGAGYDGGLTAGGAQLITPEPGGFSVLEVAPGVSDTEWVNPASSALMSRISGQILRIRLSATPQIAWSRERLDHLDFEFRNPGGAQNDAHTTFTQPGLKGAVTVSIDMAQFGRLLREGHVIGHAFDTYLIDEIEYVGTVANIIVKPPLRRDIAPGDICFFTPWFTGRISNGADIRSSYNSQGHVKLANIILQEAVV